MKKILVLGAGGFIGHHLIKRLIQGQHHVTGVDLKYPEFEKSYAHNFLVQDLRNFEFCLDLLKNGQFDEIYQLAADMGGAGYIFTGDSDADIMTNSATINLNILRATMIVEKNPKIFYSSSACVYPRHNQADPTNPHCEETSVYPADPDSEYGWEKLFSEHLYLAYQKNYGIDVKIGRFHNVYGPLGIWNNGKEKAPSAICRKVAEAEDNGSIEIWGDGQQTRTFLYIDDCLDAIELFMNSSAHGPLNIGSEEMVSINELAHIVMDIADKTLTLKHIDGPQGVRGRCSHNLLVKKTLGWSPKYTLKEGMAETFEWINRQVAESTIVNG